MAKHIHFGTSPDKRCLLLRSQELLTQSQQGTADTDINPPHSSHIIQLAHLNLERESHHQVALEAHTYSYPNSLYRDNFSALMRNDITPTLLTPTQQ